MPDRFCTRRRLKMLVALCIFLGVNINRLPLWSPPPRDPLPAKITRSEPSASSAPPLHSNFCPPAVEPPSAPAASPSSSEPEHVSSSACAGYPNDADVVIIVKTGATEASRKLPLQLVSFLSCAKDDVLIFSDMEQQIGELHVYDSLDNVVEEAKFENADFKLYNDQKQYVLEGQDIGTLSNRAEESWKLDKYKNIHTAQKAWKLRPNKSWYFFIDADTYVVWPSLFSWLKQYDATRKFYLGAEVPSEHFPFAHGGSGYALSRGALKSLVGEDAEQVARKFDADVRNICCGDIELSKSLHEKEISIIDAHPMINGDRANNYRLGPKLWCKPLITMHHIQAEEMNDFWQFERSRKSPEKPLLFEELFTSYLEPKLPSRRADWDTLSEDVKNVTIPAEREDWENFSEDFVYEPIEFGLKIRSLFRWGSPNDPHLNSYKSISKCMKACKEKPECFQYMYSDQKCQLSKSFRFGQKKEPDGPVKWTSGWDLDKINSFKKANSPCEAVDYTAYHQ